MDTVKMIRNTYGGTEYLRKATQSEDNIGCYMCRNNRQKNIHSRNKK